MRRSQGSKLPLPLDLHVLGLPLAFILSQDQTLHRMFLILYDNANFNSFFASYSLKFYNLNLKDLNRAVNPICLWTCLLFFRLFLKAGAKVQLIFYLASFFEKKFNFFSPILNLNIFFWTLPFLRVAKVNPLFDSGKLFWENFSLFFTSFNLSIKKQSPYELPCECGCKSNSFFETNKLFWKNIFLFFPAITFVIRFKISQRTLLYCGCKSSIFLL